MRWLAIVLSVLVAGGCGGAKKSAAPKFSNCVAASGPYSICGRGPKGGSGPSRIVRAGAVVAGPIEKVGRWLGLYVSPDGKTLLAQWSGACEISTAYFVSAAGGKPRPLTNYAKGSAESGAYGWRGSRALVSLPRGEWPNRKAGTYLVDPRTMDKQLVRARHTQPGC